MSSKIRILLVEENENVRQDLTGLIEAQPDMTLTAAVIEGDQVVERTVVLGPDVVLLDLSMPGCGIRVLEQLAEATPGIRIIVLAMHQEISLLRSALAFGALGYVVCKENHAELLSTIRKMSLGRAYIDVPTGGLQQDPGLDPHSQKYQDLQAKLDKLSKREREVLEAVAYGYTNREIAERIGVSVKSVETYRYRVADKLDFRSRADLVRFSLEAGLLRVGKSGFPSLEE